ncbi:TIGR03773 family transporter-associated surface protein [Schaalia sp. ZJ405]|uniref:TIGR03773 family transporter-associated surface protein n=1 Tax=Schaalia sp. ZJ405 TaxID=2709403 RepID=UPI0013EB59E5|nr:TIGR03773 family transporter-associated surface protein [Schaalia sp. ZJ405]QPK81204.1 TIGR03773 family transporter-associated surface protein [Schaalia sp. ZJ405]
MTLRILSRPRQHLLRSLMSVCALSAVIIASQPLMAFAEAPAEKETISSGKVSIFDVASGVNEESTPYLSLGVRAAGKTYEPEKVALKIPQSAYTTTHQGAPQGLPAGYVTASQNTDESPAFFWDTTRSTYYGVTLVKVSFTGPTDGRVFAYGHNDKSQPVSLAEDSNDGYEIDSTGTWLEQTGQQARHTTWIFTKPGTYTLNVQALGKKDQGGGYSRKVGHTYTVVVAEGASSLEQPAAEATETPSPSGQPSDAAGATGDSQPSAPESRPDETGTPSQPSAQGDEADADDSDEFTGDVPSIAAPKPHIKDPVSGKEMLLRTHVDAAHVYWDKENQELAVGVIDGSTLRPHDLVAVRLGPDADSQTGREVSRIKLPKSNILSFLGKPGDVLWNAPGQHYQGSRPVWAGVGSGRMPDSVNPYTLKLHLKSVKGPGWMSVWRYGGGTFAQEDLNSANPQKQSMPLVAGAHGHYNWTFSAPGRYTATWFVTAQTKDGASLTSDEYAVEWLVGTDSDVQLPEGTTPSDTIKVPTEKFTEDDNLFESDEATDEVDAENANLPAKGQYVCAAPGHYDLAASTASNGRVTAQLVDDSGPRSVVRESNTVVVPVPDSASHRVTAERMSAVLTALGPKGTKVWTLPEIQKKDLPWLGMNTEKMDYSKIDTVGVLTEIEDYTGPGRMILWQSNIMDGSKKLLDSHNDHARLFFTGPEHMHMATSFNAPGIYRASYSFLARYTKDSGWFAQSYGSHALYYAVGDEAIEQACGKDFLHSPEEPAPGTENGNSSDSGSSNGNSSDGNSSDGGSSAEEPGHTPDGSSDGDSTNGNTPGNTPGGNTPDASHQEKPRPHDDAENPKVSGSDSQFAVTLDHGHVDMLNLTADSRGNLNLMLKEDVTAVGTVREPEKVLLKVKDSAQRTKQSGSSDWPEPLAGVEKAWILPQTQDPKLLWPGWNTQGIKAAGYTKATFDVSYKGPTNGRILMWIQDALRGPESRLASGGYEMNPTGSQILQDFPAHTHVNWAFTEPGRYTLTVTAHATRPTMASGLRSAGNEGTATTTTRTYTIDVGDVSAHNNEKPTDTSVDDIVPAPLPRIDTENTGTDNAGADNAGTESTGTEKTGAENTGTENTVRPMPEAQGNENSETPAPDRGTEVCLPTTITREATAEEAATLSKAPSAAANTARTTLTFNVGPGASGNASDGHFDLGPAIENKTVLARVKDDRQQPSRWLDPAQLVFAVGSPAQLKAPAALSFVASTRSDVWMIPSTQIQGVPWLGLNSQREEIVNGTRGGVTFTLESVNGPGKFAVFNAGALGSGVGTHVFDAPGSMYTLPANTHAHQNWVFTQPGTYKVTLSMKVKPRGEKLNGSGSGNGSALTATGEKGPNGLPMVRETVGRTPSGEECALATTGAEVRDSMICAGLFLIVGTAALMLRRRRAHSSAAGVTDTK